MYVRIGTCMHIQRDNRLTVCSLQASHSISVGLRTVFGTKYVPLSTVESYVAANSMHGCGSCFGHFEVWVLVEGFDDE